MPKYPKCPKCKKEIKTLRNIVTGTMEYELRVDKDGDCEYAKMDFESDSGDNDFTCPLCRKILFNNEEDALEFLKGE